MTCAEQLVIELGHAGDKVSTVEARIARYRAIAATSASHAITAHFFQCADDLAAAEQKIGQRTLDFGRAFRPAVNGGGQA